MAYPHNNGQPPRRTANNNNNPPTTLWTILMLLVAITAVNMAVVVNSGGGVGLHPSGYAKQYFSSSSSSSTTKMKNGHNNNNNNVGGGVSGFGNQLKFDYAAATVAAKIAENNNNNADDYELNPHLDVSLIDVDPEANLFLDEQYFQAYYSSQQQQQQQQLQPMKMNKNGPENGGGNHGHHQQQQQQNHQAGKNDENGGSKFVDIRHFSLTNSASSVQLRATYGPFTSRKIINPFSVDATTSKTRTRNDSESDHPSSLNPSIRINNIHHHHPHPHPRPHKIGQPSSSSSSSSDSSNGNQNKFKPHRKHNHHHHSGDGGASGGGGGRIIKNISEQINAYLVTKEVRRSHPVLRVLFYASQLFELRNNRPTSNVNDRLQQEKSICAVVIVQFHGERLFGTCSPSQNKLGACLAEIVIPALYWPPLDVTNGGVLAAKQQKSSLAKVFYTITHITRDQQCNDQSFLSFLAMQTTSASRSNQSDAGDGDGDGETISDLFTAENSMNLLHLSDVFLVPFRGSYEEVTNDNVVTVLIPQEPVYPNSKIYIPVKYTYNPEYPVSAFSLRVQVRPGLRILGAQLSHPNKLWQLSIELGPGQTSATVTAFLRQDYDQNSAPPSPLAQQYSQQSSWLPDEFLENVSQEVYSWLIEITEDVNMNEINGRIVWQLLYETETGSYRNSIDLNVGQSLQNQPKDEHFEKESVKLTSMIDIQKDVMQEMLSITNSKELLNTAILNGRQVSRTMRIYQVSAAGRINDITFQCSCQSLDESTLKVSTSCTSVYLDGSETRGSQNATILIKYGSFIGQGNFIVWMPLLPLDIRLSDYKLSQIRGWRVHRHFRLPPMNHHYGQINGGGGSASASASASSSSSTSSLKRFDFVDEEMLADQPYGYHRSESSFMANAFSQTCQLKFQQARVEVFTKYFSIDHDSGREASLVNRRHSIRITHIVRNLIRVSDKNVLAILGGNTIEGAGVGVANVEVISPITGTVIGSKEVEVSLDRESITKMTVHLVSGLKMDVEPFAGPKHTNIWTVKTSFMNTLTKQYQEALLDARLYFSDRTSVYLSEISPADHQLSINTFKGLVDNVTRDNMEYDDDGRNDGNGHHHHHHGHHHGRQSFMHEMPRIIALMPGKGEVVQMTMDVIRACQKKRSNQQQQQQPQPLASGYINVDVNFELPETSYSLQNDAIHYRRYGNNLVGRYYSPIIINSNNNNHHNHTTKTLLNGGESFKEQINHDFDHHRHRQDGNQQQIKFQRHSIGAAAAAPYPATTTSDVSSMKFGLFGLASIIFIACFIVIIYSLITNHFNRFKQNNHQYHHSTRTITTTTTAAATVAATNRSNNNNNKLPQQCHKPYLSCLQGKTVGGRGGGGGGDRTSVLAARDWIWISKEELENERQQYKMEKAEKTKKNTPDEDDALSSQMQLRAPLLPPKDYLKEEERQQHGRSVERCQQQQQSDTTTMHITINPNETFTKRFRNPNNNNNNNNVARQQDSRNQVDITSMITPLNPSKTRHIPIPRRKRNHHAPLKNGSNRNNVLMNNHHGDDHDDVPRISTTPPPPIHRKITPPRKKPQTNQMDPTTTTANDDQTMVDLVGVLPPPPIPPHKSTTAPSQPPLIRRPQKLSLHKPNHRRSTIINDNDDDDDNDEQMERIDYRNMMKILNKLKETDA